MMLLSVLLMGFVFFTTLKEGSGAMNQKTWTFEIKSIECTSSNPDLMFFDIKNERISRGVYAISGEFSLNLDIMEDDENTIGAKSYRSSEGDGDYKSLPFQIPTSQWFKFLNSNYKDTVMETFKDCSDLPYSKEKFVGPLKKKRYTLTKCQFSQDGFPNHLQEGTYKVVVTGNGAVDWQIEVIVDVEKNL